jgi:hypothetical protein
MFEYAPVGMTTIAAFLERNHYNVGSYFARRVPTRRQAARTPLSAPIVGIDTGCRTVRGAL